MVESSQVQEVERVARDAARRIRQVVGERTRVLWFGSWVEGTAVERSDIDLAVDAGRSLGGEERARMMAALDEVETLRSFDVLDLTSIHPQRREEIEAEGRAL